jgi:hypothetical protein
MLLSAPPWSSLCPDGPHVQSLRSPHLPLQLWDHQPLVLHDELIQHLQAVGQRLLLSTDMPLLVCLYEQLDVVLVSVHGTSLLSLLLCDASSVEDALSDSKASPICS